jgi:alcohol dehydrogenase
VETAVTRKRTALSMVFSREALRLTLAGLPRVLAAPEDMEARGWMLLGAAWAGTAIENSMVGAAHSAANPLTAHFGIVHGHAVGLMLPHVVRFNAGDPAAAQTYAELACAAGLVSPSETPGKAAAQLANLLEGMLDLAGLPRSLKGLGLGAAQIPGLALEAARQWTAQFNPRPVTVADFESIYAAAL